MVRCGALPPYSSVYRNLQLVNSKAGCQDTKQWRGARRRRTGRQVWDQGGSMPVPLDDAIEEVVYFYWKYIDQLQDYKKTWYKLYQVPHAQMWPNVLCLSELLFSLLFSNSEVEKTFSALKVIKTTSFNTSTLNDLMEINIEGPSFRTFQLTRL